MKYKIPFIKPIFPKPEIFIKSYEAIVDSNWFTNFGPFERQLCSEVSSFIGNGVFVATTSNATLSIDLSIKALLLNPENIQKNQVIIPSFTFAAGPEMLISNGLTPVFIDIEQKTLQPNLQEATHYIEQNQHNVSGILLCNNFGIGNENISKWEKLASDFDIALIVDSAAGFGSKYTKDEYVGARGDCEIFSMHATKPFSVGEGGLVVSRNKNLITKIKSLENFGFNEQKEIEYIGTNAKLQELSCAIGILQLCDFKNRLINRQISLKYYKEKLEKQGYIFPENDENSTVAFVSTIAPTKELADASYKSLIDAGVEVRRYYQPLHTQKIIASRSILVGDYLVTKDIASRIISLPLHDNMSRNLIDDIVSEMK